MSVFLVNTLKNKKIFLRKPSSIIITTAHISIFDYQLFDCVSYCACIIAHGIAWQSWSCKFHTHALLLYKKESLWAMQFERASFLWDYSLKFFFVMKPVKVCSSGKISCVVVVDCGYILYSNLVLGQKPLIQAPLWLYPVCVDCGLWMCVFVSDLIVTPPPARIGRGVSSDDDHYRIAVFLWTLIFDFHALKKIYTFWLICMIKKKTQERVINLRLSDFTIVTIIIDPSACHHHF